jgi:mannose-6-phosphate isomerase-like protein (cupin superfamily)
MPYQNPRRWLQVVTSIAALMFLTTSVASPTTSTLPDPLAAGWSGVPVCERLHEDSKQRILRCSFAPGVGHERHYHASNFGYAIQGGRMRITDESGEREVDLETGSSFNGDGVAWHEVLNIGETTVVYLIFEVK